MAKKPPNPLRSAAVLKLTMILKGMSDQPGFRVVYHGTLKDLGVTDSEVNAYIEEHKAELVAQIKGPTTGE